MNLRAYASSFTSFIIYTLTTGLGLLSLFYPFFYLPVTQPVSGSQPRLGEMPLMLSLVLGLCLLVLIYEVQGQATNAKLIALLGILVAINSILRFAEVAFPGPGGFTPIFFLIVLTGYVFGGRFGFLMGAMTLFVSALITGGVGPWLPSQMFTAGWVGMSAPTCRIFIRPTMRDKKIEIILLAAFSAMWSLLYGAIMNLWTWPFMAGPAQLYWSSESTALEAFQRYLAYYLATSLVWDLAGAAGSVLLMLLFGSATLRALRRFQSRFTFYYLHPTITHNIQTISSPEQTE